MNFPAKPWTDGQTAELTPGSIYTYNGTTQTWDFTSSANRTVYALDSEVSALDTEFTSYTTANDSDLSVIKTNTTTFDATLNNADSDLTTASADVDQLITDIENERANYIDSETLYYDYEELETYVDKTTGAGYKIFNEQHEVPFAVGPGNNFGRSMDVAGDFAVVSAVGSCFVYKRQNESYVLVQTISGPGSDLFGEVVSYCSISNRILITAPLANGGLGEAYVYNYNGSTWGDPETLRPQDTTAGLEFGRSGIICSISGDYLVVGGGLAFGGYAWVFEKVNGEWKEVVVLTEEASVEFGYSVSMTGEYVIVGDPGDNTFGAECGIVHIYKRNSSAEWEKLTQTSPASGNNFRVGHSVSVYDDTLFVGLPGYIASGATKGRVAVYRRNSGTNWVSEGLIDIPEVIDGNTEFGTSVFVAGEIAIASAPRANTDKGAVYLFKPNTSNVWEYVGKIEPSTVLQEDDYYGEILSCSKGRIAIASRRRDTFTGFVTFFDHDYKNLTRAELDLDAFQNSITISATEPAEPYLGKKIWINSSNGEIRFLHPVTRNWTLKA